MLAIQKLRKFLLGTDGTTAVEYALILSLLLLAIYSAIQFTGVGNGRLYDNSSDSMQDAGLGS
ncbi:MAG: Flp family type IVb pilin [Planctomycetales bacterium]|nr:Flp family type IVb pilin [Planctomycetales bacterium]